MTTVAANLGLALFTVALLYAPAVLLTAFRRISLMLLNALGIGTLLVVTGVGYVIADTGRGLRLPFELMAAVLGVILVVGIALHVLTLVRHRALDGSAVLLWLVGCAAAAGLAILPELLALHSLGVTFGMLSNGGPDIMNYAYGATHLLDHGFAAFGNVIGVSRGPGIKADHVGAFMLSAFSAAATGTKAFSTAIPTLVVAMVINNLSIATLTRAIWPMSSPLVVGAAVVTASTGGLGTYAASQDFLGAMIGTPCCFAILAGAVAYGARRTPAPLVSICLAGGLGMFTYPPLAVPALAAAPFVCAVAAIVHAQGHRLRDAVPPFGIVVATVVGAVALAAPLLSEAVHWLTVSNAGIFGWTLRPVNAWQAFFWPTALQTPGSSDVDISLWFVVSWLAALAVAAAAVWWAARRPALRPFATMAGLLLAGVAVAMLGFAVKDGADAYATWKMWTALLPLALAATIPVCGVVASRLRPALVSLAVVGAVAAAAGPFMVWHSTQRAADFADRQTSSAFEQSLNDPRVRRLQSLNVDLHQIIPQVAVASFLPDKQIGYTSFPLRTKTWSDLDAGTCTLTTSSQLPPGATHYQKLAGPYVLLMQPSRCRTAGAVRPARSSPVDLLGGAAVQLSQPGTTEADTYLVTGSTYWIVTDKGSLRFLNGAEQARPVHLLATLGVPCQGQATSLTLTTPDGTKTFSTGAAPTLDLTVTVPAHGQVKVPFKAQGDPCTFGADPRAFRSGLQGVSVQ